MVEITENGVCYDLENTPYTFNRKGIEYHFSSETHRGKFVRNIVKREEWLADSLSRRFKVKFDGSLLAGLQLYSQVESRGYYVVVEGEVCKCRGEVQLAGMPTNVQCSGGQSQPTTARLIG